MESGEIVASLYAKVLQVALGLTGVKHVLEKALMQSPKLEKGVAPPKGVLSGCLLETKLVSGGRVYIIRPKAAVGAQHVFYLHGGAYIFGFDRLHWSFMAQLVKLADCTVVAPDYPLAPNYTYADAFAMVEPVYRELMERVGGENLVLMGDSAGGGFALALAQKMQHEGLERARHVVLLSPWLDITLENPDIKHIEPKDAILSVGALKKAGSAYAGSAIPSTYLLSPINGGLGHLGEISLFIGTNDIMLADAKKLKSIAETTGTKVNFFEYAKMPHVWMLFGLPESRQAIGQIVNLLTCERILGQERTCAPLG